MPAEVIIRVMDYDEGEEDDVIGELELPIKKTLQVLLLPPFPSLPFRPLFLPRLLRVELALVCLF